MIYDSCKSALEAVAAQLRIARRVRRTSVFSLSVAVRNVRDADALQVARRWN